MLRQPAYTQSAAPDLIACLEASGRHVLGSRQQNQPSSLPYIVATRVDTHFYHFLSLTPPPAAQACSHRSLSFPCHINFSSFETKETSGQDSSNYRRSLGFSCCTYPYITYIQQHTAAVAVSHFRRHQSSFVPFARFVLYSTRSHFRFFSLFLSLILSTTLSVG